ncbi:MAG: Hsp70 family protein, partial [Defluviitaleaceae bacterium]|nr:Hsp70 family protein [Defluviitaleaceae bacterium]
VAAFIDGKSTLIPNSHGELLTPSVVGLTEDGQIIVGKSAKERLITHPTLTASLFKRHMGTDHKIKLGKKEFLPEELSSLVLRQLLEDAANFLDEPVTEAVISVPAYFNANQRAATKIAGTLSGVTVERLVNEPSAAALACRNWDKDETFIVFDFGGGTLDVSVVEAFDNLVNICSISGNNALGGTDFDQAIVTAVCEAYGLNEAKLPKQDYNILLKAAENAKVELQNNDESTVTATIQNKKIAFPLNGSKLYHLSQDIFDRIKNPIRAAVQGSGLEVSDIDKCILVGGSCHMPIVQEYLNSLLRVPVTDSDDLDRIVALGLGTYVGIKQREGSVKDLVLTDICPFSLNIGVHNEADPTKTLSHTMIARNTALPTSRTEPFFTIQPGQTEIGCPISQGEGMYSDTNTQLGKVTIKVPYNKTANEQINVTFTYDINAILAVQAESVSTGAKEQLILTGKNAFVSDAQIEKYVESIQRLKLAHHERIDFLLEKAKRIYEEADEYQKHHMKEIVIALENLRKGGSMRKAHKALDEIDTHLSDIDKSMGGDDIFNNKPAFLRLIKGGVDDGDLDE